MVEASIVQAIEAEDQAMMASTCMMFLEEEHPKMIVQSPGMLRVEARECLYQAKANKMKDLEDQIKKPGCLK